MADESGTKPGRAAPYIAFQTLKTFFDELQKHGTPSRIDRSVLTRFSGAVGSQLVTALKFLQLIDDNAHPTAWLHEMVAAYGTDNWQTRLNKLLLDSYPVLFGINLQNATPSQFNEVFRDVYPAKENVLRKCVGFFLNAARDAGVNVSPRILKNSKPRAPNGNGPRRRAVPAMYRPSESEPAAQTSSAQNVHTHSASYSKTPSQLLLDILNPAVMSLEEQQAVWTLLLYLKKADAQ